VKSIENNKNKFKFNFKPNLKLSLIFSFSLKLSINTFKYLSTPANYISTSAYIFRALFNHISQLKILLFSLLFTLVTACQSQFASNYQAMTDQSLSGLGCSDFEQDLWAGIKEFLIQTNTFPDPNELDLFVTKSVKNILLNRKDLSESEINNLNLALSELLTTVLTEARAQSKSPAEMIYLISALDVGNKAYNKTVIQSLDDTAKVLIENVQSYVKMLNLECQNEVLPEKPFSFDEFPNFSGIDPHDPQKLAAWGAKWSIATAYQSCSAHDQLPLNAQSPAIKGVTVVGTHSSGTGSVREISSLEQLQNTQPYLKDTLTYQQCFDIYSNPLIYDYGGKPYATTQDESELNFFKDAGNGSNELGIDCSGFVFSSLATSGLKLKANRNLKAIDAWSWNSASYINPQENGLTCLNRISISPDLSLKQGDIVAINGHIFIISQIGQDPFGIKNIISSADCSTKINYKNFDFIIAQSSSSKGGIGLNYFKGSDYLATESTFRSGFIEYAKSACLAKVQLKTITPKLNDFSIVRHLGTPECMSKRIPLTHESCISRCSF